MPKGASNHQKPEEARKDSLTALTGSTALGLFSGFVARWPLGGDRASHS